MMMTQNGKLLYISDNAAEYLGHSMVSTYTITRNGACARHEYATCILFHELFISFHNFLRPVHYSPD